MQAFVPFVSASVFILMVVLANKAQGVIMPLYSAIDRILGPIILSSATPFVALVILLIAFILAYRIITKI